MQVDRLSLHAYWWEQIIDRHPPVVSPATTLVDGMKLLSQRRKQAQSTTDPSVTPPDCLLVAEDGYLVGLLSAGALVELVADGIDLHQSLATIIGKPETVVRFTEEHNPSEEIIQFYRAGHRYLPVVDDRGTLIGLITPERLLQARLNPTVASVVKSEGVDELQSLHTITRLIGDSPDLTTALEICLHQVCSTMGWEYGEAWIPNTTTGALHCITHWCSEPNQLQTLTTLSGQLTCPLGKGLPGRVWQTHQPEWIGDIATQSTDCFIRAATAAQIGLRTGLGVPIIANEIVLAVLTFFTTTVRQEDGQLIHRILNVTDPLSSVIQRKRAEAAMHRSEARNRALLNAIPDMIFRYDRRGIHLDYVPARALETIVSPENFLGRPVTEILPLEVGQEIVIAIEQALESQETVICQYRLSLNGEFRDYEARIVACAQDEVLAIVRDISESVRHLEERRQLERELKSALQRLTFHVENSPLAVIEWDHDFRVCRWSHEAETVFGWSAEEVMGHHPLEWQFVHSEDKAMIQTAMERLIAGEISLVCANRNHRKNGTIVHCEWYNSALVDESGNLISILSLVLDVSDRREAETVLADNEARWRSLIQNSSDLVFISDVRDRIIYISPSVERILGYRPEEMLNTIGFSGVHPDDLNFISQAFAQLVSQPVGSISPVVEYQFRHKNGSWVFLESIGTNLIADPAVQGIVVNCRDITERKQAEAALRASEQRLSLHIQQTPLAVIEWNLNFEISDWNLAAERIFGYSREEVIGRLGLDLLVPESSRAPIRKLWQALLNQQGGIHVTNATLTRDHKIIVCEWYNTALVNDQGEVIGAASLVQNITDRVQAEAALRQAKAELEQRVEERTIELRQTNERLTLNEQAITASNNGVVIVDARSTDLPIIFVNPAFERLTGYSAAEVIGENCRFLQRFDPHQPALSKIRDAIRKQQSCTVIIRNYRKDGSAFWNELSISPIFDPDGDLIHYVGVQNDITQRVSTEHAMQQQLAAIEAATDGIAILNPRGEYTYLNSACVHLLGYESAQDLIGKTWHETYSLREATRIEQEILPILRQKGQWRGEANAQRRNGSEFAQEISMSLVQGGGMICVCQDVSSRKQAEASLKASLQEKEVLLKEIHHRVKNNLQVVSSLLKLQAGYIKDRQTLEVFKESQNRVRAMALIHEKLYQSKDLARTDFADYIHNLTRDIVRSYGNNARPVNLDLNISESLLSIDAAIPCGLIINELLSNCLKYAFPLDWRPGERGKIQITFSPAPTGEYILTVADNGIGLPDSLDVYHTQSLGLQLVCTLATQIQGTIEVDRTHGTAFKLTFTDIKPKSSH